ncbi:ATP-grasp fold amidoligase family protein [Flavobacterium pectinovorum]|uniref:ATP-grasp fold amidoligase family protein n=1 Tax=Flavobacterium pectinovorum TaxID=29533 RepID=UPI001FAD3420|nr:ATP-grasp fold amidoligase family protein [Flavobacterium pectinovorum]MCI9844940.1 glycosyltransferase [Flavobacterium pectinovorum]
MESKLNNFILRKYNQTKAILLSKYSNNDAKVTKAKYFCKNKRVLNLDNPQEFMEKIQWLKLYHYKEEYGQYVDKFDVRSFVEAKVGKEYLNEIIGVYNTVEEIDFENLPQQYAIRGTHGSGYNLIVKNASLINNVAEKNKLRSFLKSNYYDKYRETIYKNVKPRLLIEKFISNNEDGLIDYKFYCFHGQPKYVLVKKTENGKEKKCFYDLNWRKIISNENDKNWLKSEIEKPANFDEMLKVASALSDQFIFLRVDLYSVDNKILFGELTFFPTGGHNRFPVDYLNLEMGNLIQLPI